MEVQVKVVTGFHVDTKMIYAHVEENTNKLVGWYDDSIQDAIPEPKIPVTAMQWQNAIDNDHNTVYADGSTTFIDYRTEQEKIDYYRTLRDQILEVQVDPIMANQVRWNSMSDEEKSKWERVRTELLDVPQQSGFPNNIVWPDEID